MITFDIAQRLLQATDLGGGSTFLFDNDLLNPRSGYSVANGTQGCKFTKVPETAYVVALMEQFKRLGYDGVGTWVDKGVLYVDPILWVADGQVALAYGALWNELAIYNHNTGLCITCTPDIH